MGKKTLRSGGAHAKLILKVLFPILILHKFCSCSPISSGVGPLEGSVKELSLHVSNINALGIVGEISPIRCRISF